MPRSKAPQPGSSSRSDVLIVGAGPAGSAAAIGLAQAGHRVVIVERERFPRAKPCGELIIPRGVAALAELGVDPPGHRIAHVRLTHGKRSTSTVWPDGAHAVVVPREVLDAALVDRAREFGAELLDGHTAVAPIVNRGFVRGARVTRPDGTTVDIEATYTLVADGANSRFGRALGTFRQPDWTHATVHRARYRSALHDAAEVELLVDLRDPACTPITGYAFMFPRGDGTVNVGLVAMSTSPSYRVLNPPRLLDAVVAEHGAAWHLDPQPVEAGAGGRLPLGASVGPAAGPTYLVVGDAAGAGNPLSGAGIDQAIDTGRLAGTVLATALESGSASELQRYPRLLDERYGTYFQVGRLTSRLIGRPSVNVRATRLVASRRPAADALLRIAANQLRPGGWGLAEAAYRTGRTIALVAPNA